LKKFPDEKSTIEYFTNQRFPEGVICPNCKRKEVKKRKDNPKFYHCNFCNYDFSVFKDTIFEKTSTDLQKWFYAIHLFLNAKKGISAKQLQREIRVTYKTAWRMLHQIRKAMEDKNHNNLYEAIIEMDETYIGGKPRKPNKRDDDIKGGKLPRGRATNKPSVIGVLDRKNRKVFAKVALRNRKGQRLTFKQLIDLLNQVCKGKNVVITDEYRGYQKLRYTQHFHLQIDHNKMFVDSIVHTNTIESFWAIVKRAIYEVYHRISVKYLQAYINWPYPIL